MIEVEEWRKRRSGWSGGMAKEEEWLEWRNG